MLKLKITLTIALFVTSHIAMSVDKKTVRINTPSGEVTFKEQSLPTKKNFKNSETELSSDEVAALKQDSLRATGFISYFITPKDQSGDILEDLDSAFTAWLKSGKRDVYSENDIVQIVGASLGWYVNKHLGLRWARVTDEYGSAIALVGDEPQIQSFPFSSVQYRIEDKKTDFIVAFYRTLEHTINSASKH